MYLCINRKVIATATYLGESETFSKFGSTYNGFTGLLRTMKRLH